MITVSASRIKTFLECQNKFYLHYILEQKEPKTIYLVRGTAIHEALESFHNGNVNPFQVYQDSWKQQMQEYPYIDDNSRLFYEGDAMLEMYVHNFGEPIPGSIAELSFTLPFPNATNPIAIIEGFMDYVYADVIIDFKTGRNAPTQEQLNNDPQFILYSWAFQQMYNVQPRIYWYHMRTGEYIEAQIDSSKISWLVTVIQEMEQFLQSPSFVERPIPCQYCRNKEMCKNGTIVA